MNPLVTFVLLYIICYFIPLPPYLGLIYLPLVPVIRSLVTYDFLNIILDTSTY